MRWLPRQNRCAAIFFMILFHAEKLSAQFGMEQEIAEDSNNGFWGWLIRAIVLIGIGWYLKEIFEGNNHHDKSQNNNANDHFSSGVRRNRDEPLKKKSTTSPYGLHKSSISEQEKTSCTNILKEDFHKCESNEEIHAEKTISVDDIIYAAEPVAIISEEEIKSLIAHETAKEDKTNVDFEQKFGMACYSSDYKKFLKLDFKYYIKGNENKVLKILEGTKSICSDAVSSERLEQIILPSSLVCIGDRALYNCKALKEIILPTSLQYIGDSAFCFCEKLNKITIPPNVSYIGVSAFSNTGLKKIVNYSPYFRIKDDCLYDEKQQRLIRYFGSETEFEVPFGVTEITGAFSGCDSLEKIILPRGLKSFGLFTFMNCINLKEIIIQRGLIEIGPSAFCGCRNLEKIVIPNGVKIIGDDCFKYCENLRYVVMPDTIEHIDGDIFRLHYSIEKCISLKYIFIPQGTKEKFLKFFPENLLVEGTPEDFFEKREQLDNIRKSSVNLETTFTEEDVQDGWSDTDGVRYSADGKRLLYSTRHSGNTVFLSGIKVYKVKEGTTVICDHAFDSGAIESIELPDTVEIIGDSAFSGCKNLKSICLPPHVCHIGKYAFSRCSSLRSIVLPSSLEVISEYMFYMCSSLTEIIFPLSVKEIRKYAFYNTSLHSLNIPEGVKFLGVNAFGGCEKVQNIKLPSTIREIEGNPWGAIFSDFCHKGLKTTSDSPKYIFENEALYTSDRKILISCLTCSTDFNVQDGVEEIADNAFSENHHLRLISLPTTLIRIGVSAFEGCQFTHILMPDSIKTIDDCAFYNCNYLTEIHIPNKLEYLGNKAFYGCKWISKLIFPESLSTLAAKTLEYCDSLASVTILNPDMNIDDNVFVNLQSLVQVEFGGFSSSNSLGTINWPQNLKEIIVPNDNYNQFCSIFPSIKEIINNNTIIDEDNQQLTELSTIRNDIDWINSTTDDYEVSYSGDGKKLLLCEETVRISDPIIGESGKKVIKFNNNWIDYESFLFIRAAYYTIKHGTEVICNEAFSHWESLYKIHFPGSVKAIGHGAFQGCKLIDEIVLPNNIKVISDFCFAECRSLTNIILPKNLVSIGKCGFGGCYSLTNIALPQHIKVIEVAAFRACPLNEICLPDGLERIDKEAFWGARIKEICFPQSLKYIGQHAFSKCEELKKIEFKGVDVDFDITAFTSNPYGGDEELMLDVIYVPKGSKPAFVDKIPQYKEIIVEQD